MGAILLTLIYFLNMIRPYILDEVDLTSESLCLEIGLLTSRIIYHNVV